MGKSDQNLAIDVFAWLSNVLTSILLIFLTKWLFTLYSFVFATTTCGLHFISCAIAIRTASALGYVEHVAIPFKYTLLFSFVGGISIASANLSLLLNTVGFYQIAKLALAPFVCFVESVFLKKQFSRYVHVAIAAVLTGVGIVTVSDVQINLLGMTMAVIFVVSSGLQQILCGHFQAKFKVASHQLLANTSPVQGMMLLVVGPFLDLLVTDKWIGTWDINVPALELLGTSCLVAIAVNLSQFLCLGRFSATSFQVLGHAKTVLVLVGGWALFHEYMNVRQLAGISLAVVGMIAYGYFMNNGGVKTSSTGGISAPLLESGSSRPSQASPSRSPQMEPSPRTPARPSVDEERARSKYIRP